MDKQRGVTVMQTHLEAQRKSAAVSHLSRLLVLAITLLSSLVFVVDDLLPQVRVRGYHRKDGTYVRPHVRTRPDGNPYNNYSFPGNYNPNTGKITPGNPETYLKNYYNRSGNNYSSPGNGNPNTVTNDPEIPRIQLRNYENSPNANETSSEQVHQRPQKVLTMPNLPAIGSTYTKISKAESNRRYSEALQTFERSEYSKAITLFSTLLKENSNDNLSDNSQYWIGECYYGAGDFQNSITAFKKVFTFSDNDKYDDALLKLGLCYMRIGDRKQAKVYFDQILDEYPESEYLGKARHLSNKIE